MKIPRCSHELKEHLEEQLQHLHNSCVLFDKGQLSEAKRIATVVRILIYDYKKSSLSLLKQIGIKESTYYVDTSIGTPFGGVGMSYEGLCLLNIVMNEARFIPILNDHPTGIKYFTFERWWNRVIVKSDSLGMFSRRDIILFLSNKDGGAHVDPAIEEKYYKLQKVESTGWVSKSINGVNTIFGVELSSARQIGHEILLSLNPSYVCDYQKREGAVVGGARLTMSGKKDTDRNALCPCGSKKKYKKCCM